MSTVADLWAVQTTDLALDALKQRIEGKPGQLPAPVGSIAARLDKLVAEAERER